MNARTSVLIGVAVGCAVLIPVVLLFVMMNFWMMAPAPVNNAWPVAQGPALQFDMPEEMFGDAPQAALPVAQADVPQVRGPAVATGDYRLTGPFTHANLSVFFVHGQDAAANHKVLPLHHALHEGLAVVHDRGMLSIDNRSDLPLFVQAGDIVKGGNQDRVLPYDYLIPVGARNFQVTAFCVEAGRSSPRGQEVSSSFAVANEQLPTRALKLAALYRRSQQHVWSTISQTQTDLGRNLGNSVQAPLSQTSLQLTLEHPAVNQAAHDYLTTLFAKGEQEGDTIGVVVAINGQIQSADVYASADLFQKLWPKLIRAHAVAAVAEKHVAVRTAPDAAAVQTFLVEAERGPAVRQASAGRVHLLRHETERSVLLESCDTAQNNLVVHRCYLAK